MYSLQNLQEDLLNWCQYEQLDQRLNNYMPIRYYMKDNSKVYSHTDHMAGYFNCVTTYDKIYDWIKQLDNDVSWIDKWSFTVQYLNDAKMGLNNSECQVMIFIWVYTEQDAMAMKFYLF